uniref:hypothetical protein n=1 Tax=Methylocaldum sp. TaxID=1969727 RepID=UPI00321F76E3
VTLDSRQAPAVAEMIHRSAIGLDSLMRDPVDRNRQLPCIPLMVVRSAEDIEIPAPELMLREGDSILFAGLSSAIPDQQSILRNLNVLNYVLFGTEVASSWLWRKLTGAEAGL